MWRITTCDRFGKLGKSRT